MMAASKGISIRDYFLQQMEKTLPATDGKKLGRRTRKALEKADKHQNLHFAATTEEFYRELGLNKYIETKQDAATPAPKNIRSLAAAKLKKAA